MQFSEHGNFQLETDGNIIYYRVIGCWNKEASKACLQELAKGFEQLKDKPIMMIVDSINFEGGIEEAYPLWHEDVPSWFESGMTHFIRIDDPESIRYHMFVERMDKVMQENVQFRFAADLNDAIKQAHSLGFSGFDHTLSH